MNLEVPISEFTLICKQWGCHEIYVASQTKGSVVSAAHPKEPRVVVSYSSLTIEKLKDKLSGADLDIKIGSWVAPIQADVELENNQEIYTVAISYQSDELKPGVWVDAFPYLPTPMQALRAIYDEFRSTGEIGDVSFEEFMRLAHPNVAIVSPSEIATFAAQKQALEIADTKDQPVFGSATGSAEVAGNAGFLPA